MGQQSLIYSFVARGTVIVAEYTEFTGNFTSIAHQCLHKLPASNNKFTYDCDRHTFNYFVEDGFAYCVVADESVGRQVPMAFLERIKDDFKKRYGGGRADTAVAHSLNKEFGPRLKEHMEYCVNHPEEINKFSKVKTQVSEVKGVMMDNIEKVSYSICQKPYTFSPMVNPSCQGRSIVSGCLGGFAPSFYRYESFAGAYLASIKRRRCPQRKRRKVRRSERGALYHLLSYVVKSF